VAGSPPAKERKHEPARSLQPPEDRAEHRPAKAPGSPSHQINHIAGSTSHVVHFIGGGRLCYAYNGRGQIIEVSAWHVMVRLGPENQCIFSALA